MVKIMTKKHGIRVNAEKEKLSQLYQIKIENILPLGICQNGKMKFKVPGVGEVVVPEEAVTTRA